MQKSKLNLIIRKSGVTTWITPLSYDFLIVAYLILLHLLKVGVLDIIVGVRLGLLTVLDQMTRDKRLV